ncbi:MAG: hypothetical protein LH618_09005 [Saprospiraceae bacterium]|nr:hypothetical protein [Saprospiraceae bacterium]
MLSEEKVLNPEESLRVIRETIDLAKSSLRENGFHFLLWGWLVVAACLAHYYLLVVMHWSKAPLVWLGMTVVGVPVAFLYEARRERKQARANIVRNWYGRTWLGFGISMFVVIFLTVANRSSPIPFILVLVGFATFISGSLLRFKPLVLGAIAAWVAALACIYLVPSEQLLAQAVATILSYLIPGYLLNKANARHA